MAQDQKPREFWIRPGLFYGDRDEIFTSDIQETGLIHVIEYLAYNAEYMRHMFSQKLVVVERARNQKLREALEKINGHFFPPGMGIIHDICKEALAADVEGK